MPDALVPVTVLSLPADISTCVLRPGDVFGQLALSTLKGDQNMGTKLTVMPLLHADTLCRFLL